MSKASLFTPPPRALAALLLALVVFAGTPRVLAQANSHPPERMTYQGYLVDANGNALAPSSPKNYDLVFRIWSDSSSTAPASRLWTEQQTVTVDKGYFSVLLGEGSNIGEARPNLSTLFTNATASDRWVGITVNGIGAGGTPVNILPRLRLLTSPYAFLARGVSGAGVVNANNLAPAVASGLWTASGADIYRSSGNVGIGTTTPGFPLGFANALGDKISLWGQSGNSFGFGIQGSLLQIHTDTSASDVAFGYGSSAAMTETMRVKGNGQVGIGTSTIHAWAKLQVSGGATMPSAGGGADQGIEFPPDAFGGSGDRAYIKYWAPAGESGRLELGTQNDPDDHILLMPSGNVGIGTAAPAAKLDVNGNARVASTLRMGSETGTSEPPNYTGLVVRRINSFNSAAGQVVARSETLTLERDGTPGGFIIRGVGPIGGSIAAGTAITASGTSVNVYRNFYGGFTGTVQLFTTAQKVGHFTISFGEPWWGAQMTTVVLTRFVDTGGNDSANWIGTVTSTANQ